jgi:hypothetical protein
LVGRVHSLSGTGLLLRGLLRRRVRQSVAFGEIVTAERLSAGYGFRLYGRAWLRLVVLMRRSTVRVLEEQLRARNVVIVDEYGARIDDSQFAKEADPNFNRNVDDGFPPFLVAAFAPMFVVRWWSDRSMRHWSDRGSGE